MVRARLYRPVVVASPAGRTGLREARAAPDRAPAVLISSLARARESFELCSHFKSLPPVPDRELSADLTWRAHRRKPEFPALGSETQSRCVQGERGVNTQDSRNYIMIHFMFWDFEFSQMAILITY